MRLKSLVVSVMLATSVFAQTTNPPQELEGGKWVLTSWTTGYHSLVYADFSSSTLDSRYDAVTLWLKIFDKDAKQIVLEKWAYRNEGSEYTVIAKSTYNDNQSVLITSLSFQPWQVSWQAVVPGTIADGVLQELVKYYKWKSK